MTPGQAPLLNTSGRKITIDFAPTGVVGQLRMQVSYEGIPRALLLVVYPVASPETTLPIEEETA
jgi:hypothetical protein